MSLANAPPLIDAFARRITYLRVSVTDRCDLRCLYCMSEHTRFAPKSELLSYEELDRLCAIFVQRGVRRLRITGGEPLMRRGLIDFLNGLQRHRRSGLLDEVTLTTNGTRLAEFAQLLKDAGVARINVSLDSLDRETFARITRRDRLDAVLDGIAAAQAVGLRVKINTVALARDNQQELPGIIQWAHARGMDISVIETMPLGEIDEDRTDQYISLAEVRRTLASYWRLEDIPSGIGGPSRYVRVRETGGRLGFITPLSQHFCATCDRVRLTCSGRLFLCLGREESVDFRAPLRAGISDQDLSDMLDLAIARKPERHDFRIERGAAPSVPRFMSATGG